MSTERAYDFFKRTTDDDFKEPIDIKDEDDVIVDMMQFMTLGKTYQGGFRTVILPDAFPDIVIKIERDIYNHCNAIEESIYSLIENGYEEFLPHVAKVYGISKSGRILVQQRVDKMISVCDMCKNTLKKTEVPKFFMASDNHFGNYGFIDGKIVLIDYSFLSIVPLFNEGWVEWETWRKLLQTKPHIKNNTLGKTV